MKNLTLAIATALSLIFVIPTVTEARPKKTVMTLEKKQKLYAHRCELSKKSRKYRRYASYCKRVNKVTAKSTPSQEQINAQVASAWIPSLDDNSAAAFFARDRMRMEGTAQTNTAVVKSTNKKKPKRNTWFKSSPVTIAKRYEGMSSRKNRQTLKTLLSVDPARIPWCAAFANAMLARAGYEGTGSLMARSFLNYGTITSRPTEGDIVVFRRGRSRTAGHVGFYVGEQVINGQKYILTLGGNQSRSVNVAYMPASRVIGYRKIG